MFPTTLLEDFVRCVWLRSRQARKFALLAKAILVSSCANSLRDGAAGCAALPELLGAAVEAGRAALPGQLETAEAKERFMAPCCKQNLEPNIEAFVALATVHWSDLIIFTDSIFTHVSSVFQEGSPTRKAASAYNSNAQGCVGLQGRKARSTFRVNPICSCFKKG